MSIPWWVRDRRWNAQWSRHERWAAALGWLMTGPVFAVLYIPLILAFIRLGVERHVGALLAALAMIPAVFAANGICMLAFGRIMRAGAEGARLRRDNARREERVS